MKMDTIVDNVTPRLAERIAIERKARGWSPAELATRAGISRAMIAKVESGESSPTAMLLAKLSGALGMSMSTLLARAEAANNAKCLPFDAQAVWRDPESGYVRRQVFPVPGSNVPLDLASVELPAGAEVTFPASAYAFGRYLIWMQSGDLVLTSGDVEHHLRAGDSFEFGAPRDCRFENRTRKACVYAVLVTRGAD